MNLYSYVVKHDYGFAPNPFGGFLTLATCKPLIRKNARLGDFLAGTGSAASVGNTKLVYAGEISAVVPLEEYGKAQNYNIKRPASKPSFRRKGDKHRSHAAVARSYRRTVVARHNQHPAGPGRQLRKGPQGDQSRRKIQHAHIAER